MVEMQAVRFLWNSAVGATDSIRDEGMIQLLFRGREKPVEAYSESPDQIYDLFTNLQHGPDVVAYPRFEDEDGELFQLNPLELVWISAPTHLLTEGGKRIAEEDGLDFENDA